MDLAFPELRTTHALPHLILPYPAPGCPSHHETHRAARVGCGLTASPCDGGTLFLRHHAAATATAAECHPRGALRLALGQLRAQLLLLLAEQPQLLLPPAPPPRAPPLLPQDVAGSWSVPQQPHGPHKAPSRRHATAAGAAGAAGAVGPAGREDGGGADGAGARTAARKDVGHVCPTAAAVDALHVPLRPLAAVASGGAAPSAAAAPDTRNGMGDGKAGGKKRRAAAPDVDYGNDGCCDAESPSGSGRRRVAAKARLLDGGSNAEAHKPNMPCRGVDYGGTAGAAPAVQGHEGAQQAKPLQPQPPRRQPAERPLLPPEPEQHQQQRQPTLQMQKPTRQSPQTSTPPGLCTPGRPHEVRLRRASTPATGPHAVAAAAAVAPDTPAHKSRAATGAGAAAAAAGAGREQGSAAQRYLNRHEQVQWRDPVC